MRSAWDPLEADVARNSCGCGCTAESTSAHADFCSAFKDDDDDDAVNVAVPTKDALSTCVRLTLDFNHNGDSSTHGYETLSTSMTNIGDQC
jgi:hypothetical protein